MPDEATAKACCADLYQSEVARFILGDTLHPGGLALTNRLGRLMGIRQGDRVLDLASGRGESALAVSRVFRCNVIGVEFGTGSLSLARRAALDSPNGHRVRFVRGDAESPPLQADFFDAVFCECSMSLFPHKTAATAEVVRLLKPGGAFGFSDVTVEPGSLPQELNGDLGRILCLADALNVQGYLDLLEDSGLVLQHHENASAEVLKLLDEVEAKLGAFMAWQNITSQANTGLESVPRLLSQVRELVTTGKLGYWLFVAHKPR